MKECDNRSVGVVINDDLDRTALLQRARFPIGIAPPAGHVDEHGSPEEAALAEVHEEVGLTLAIGGLVKTHIQGRRVANRCRRPGGDYHDWWVYTATVPAAGLQPDAVETMGAGWYSAAELQKLADRYEAYRNGSIGEDAWQVEPGLEPVWYEFISELGRIVTKPIES